MSGNLRKKIYAITLSAFMLSSIGIQSAFAQSTIHSDALSTKIESKFGIGKDKMKAKQLFRKGEVIVKYKTNNNIESYKTNIKDKIKNKISKYKSFNPKSKTMLSENTEVISVDENENISTLVEKLEKEPGVLYAQPNYTYYADYTPQDEQFSEQWGCQNSATGIDINATKAWDITKGSSSVVVGVIDTEVAFKHDDLVNNIYVNPNEIVNGRDDDGSTEPDDINGWNFVDDNKEIFNGNESYHGTHVSGTIAATANIYGVIGVAPNVKVMPLKCLEGPESEGDTSYIVKAIKYASIMGVKILNLSLSGTSYDPAFYDAIQANPQILFVVSAGNKSNDLVTSPRYPACYDLPNILTVASISKDGSLSPFSCYGNPVDIAAPGNRILSTAYSKDANGKIVFDYCYADGTSMATPHVTGVAALIKSLYPNATTTEIINRIKNMATVNELIKDKVPGGLVLDSCNSLQNVTGINFTKSISKENSLYFEWQPVQGATIYKVQAGYGIPFGTTTASFNFNSLEPDTAYTFKVTALDSAGQVIAEKRYINKTLRLGTGTGLNATYFNDTSMNDQKVSKTQNIDFNWGSGSPDPSINNQSFSALYTGELEAKYTEEYTLFIQTLGASKVWFDGNLIFNRSADNSDTITELSTKINLKAYYHYPIQIEYYESSGNASIKLLWASPSQKKEVVPSSRLYLSRIQDGIWNVGGEAYKNSSIHITHACVEGGKLYNVTSPAFSGAWLEVYDEAQNKFTKLKDLPNTFGEDIIPFLYHGIAPLDGKLYLFTTHYEKTQDEYYTYIQEYDISTGNIVEKHRFLYETEKAISVNGKIFVFGGRRYPEVRLYNPVSGTLTPVAQLPDTALRFYAIAQLDKYIYLSGGDKSANGVDTYSKNVYAFDTNNYQWSNKKEMPETKIMHRAVAKNGDLYVFGGMLNPTSGTNSSFKYNPTTDSWDTAPSLISERNNFGLVNFNNKIFAIYGSYGNIFSAYNYFDVLEDRYATTYKISGYLKPDLTSPNALIKSGFKVEIEGFGKMAISDQNGYFEISGLPSNVNGYNLNISKNSYLYRKINNIKVKASNVQISTQSSPIDIWAGDIVQDKIIDSNDVSEINKCMGTVLGNANFNPACDLNMDNMITSTDLNILNNHIGATTASYPNLY